MGVYTGSSFLRVGQCSHLMKVPGSLPPPLLPISCQEAEGSQTRCRGAPPNSHQRGWLLCEPARPPAGLSWDLMALSSVSLFSWMK